MSVEREMSLAEWCAELPSLHLVNQELSTLNKQLAALAEQNAKLKDALKTVVDDAEECTDHDDWTAVLLSLEAYHIASTCLEEIDELPDLASPVLNRIRAEGMEMAAKWFNDHVDNRTDTWQAQELRRMAAEL